MADLRSNAVLKGWKSIADFFGRDQSTVMRWAAQRGLPVRRVPGAGRSSVYALPDELTAWLVSEERAGPQAAEPHVVEPQLAELQMAEPEVAEPTRFAASDLSAAPLRGTKRGWIVPTALAAAVAAVATLAIVTTRMPATPTVHHARPAFADPAIERAYLAATYDLDLRTPTSLTRATAEFGAIIARDPAAAAAYAALGETYLLRREYTAFPDALAYRNAAAAAKAAISLDPDSLAAHRVLAFVAFWGAVDVLTARAEFARARELNPNDAQTWHWYATALSANGEAQAALDAIGEARRLEPQSTPIASDYGLLAYLAGHRAEGLAALHAVAAGSPSHMSTHRYLADLALVRGEGATYLSEAAIASGLKADTEQADAVARDRAAYRDRGEAGLLAAIASRLAATNASHFDRARIAALQGHHTAAIAELREAAAAHETGLAVLPGEIALRGLIGDPWFDAMRQRASLTTGTGIPSGI